MRLGPFFSYYGAKHRAAAHYPRPAFGTLIEPFAGSAGYATRHSGHNVILSDLDERIVGVWRFLIRAKESEILALPTQFDRVSDLRIAQEARWFLGFWIVKGASYPRNTPSNWMKSGRSWSIFSDDARSGKS